jgi:hypothetical protein
MRAHGAVPDGLVIDHVKDRGCRFRDCVNVDHLEPVTLLENSRRGQPDGVWGGDWGQAAKEECPAGHAYDEANTYVWRKAGKEERGCRTCRREANRRWLAKKACASSQGTV